MNKYKILCLISITVLLFFSTANNRANATEMSDQRVSAVEVPQNLNFFLDPENEYGRGQIYSDKYMIRNAGSESITFSIEMALSVISDQAAIAFRPEKWDAETAGRSIYMYVTFEGSWGEDRYTLTDSSIPCMESFVLEPAGTDGDTAYISFGGALSLSDEWKSGELAINSVYTMSADSMKYSVSIDGGHVHLKDNIEKIAPEEKAELYLIPDEGYFLPSEIQVFINDTETAVPYDAASGKITLADVTGDVRICANGIAKATLPSAEVFDTEQAVWSWTANAGIQAYEYSFLQNGEAVCKGRLDASGETVNWNWSEGLENGSYELRLKAIGDAVNCMNSEEGSYSVTVSKELLQAQTE